MDVTSTQTVERPASSPPLEENNAANELASDFNTFLKLLSTQLKNQDPLNPLDSNDFAVQLATFSGVEQQVQGNEYLKTLADSLSGGALTQVSGWIGREALVAAPAQFTGQPLTIRPALDTGTSAASLEVRDSQGRTVDQVALGLDGDDVQWTGVDSNGAPFPHGNYTFHVIAESNGTSLPETQAAVFARVTEARVEHGTTKVVLSGGVAVPTTDVLSLREED
jgi:flagellar basal-body rod modification protein FlgD